MANSNVLGLNVGRDLNVNGNLVNIVNGQQQAAPIAQFRCNLHFPSPHYQGREKILNDILAYFQSVSTQKTDCWTRMVTIGGMGGIGKSETACKFAHDNEELYPCVAWINAETEHGALNSFLHLAKSLGIVKPQTQAADLGTVGSVYDHIDKHCHDNVLLIFDNALQLNSRDSSFGIFDYLPTKVLANQPYVIITSQTINWQKGMKTFPLEKLSEQDSLSFYRSTFKVSSPGCDEAYKDLHIHLQGYPLAMTLAASNIGFNSEHELIKEIEQYVKNFKEEDSSILFQEIDENWPNDYNKTLSTVWQLTFKRLLKDPNAIILLQALSFFHVPLSPGQLRCVFIECPYCPGTPDWIKDDCLKKSIRLLQKFNLVHDVHQPVAEEVKGAKSFWFQLSVHRLVQLVVRLDTNCSLVLEDILRYMAFWTKSHVRQLNRSAVEEALGRTTLSTRALAFVGLLALKGNRAARRIVQARPAPVHDPAATIWRILQLDKSMETLNSESIEVLRAFVELTISSETSFVDRRCFVKMALDMFEVKRIFPYVRDDGSWAEGILLRGFAEVEDIACKLISTACSFNDVEACSAPWLCTNVQRSNEITFTVLVGNAIIEDLTKVKKGAGQIEELKEKLRAYRELVDRGHDKWFQFQEEMQEIFYLVDSQKRFESEIKSCGLDHVKLKQVFSSLFDKIWTATGNKNFPDNKRVWSYFTTLDKVIGALLRTPRSREILTALMVSFIEIPGKPSVSPYLAENGAYVLVWIFSTWVNFCLQDGCLNSVALLRCVSLDQILTHIRKLAVDEIPAVLQVFNDWEALLVRHEKTYKDFIEIYSKTPVEEFRALLPFCTQVQKEMLGHRK